MRILQVLFPHGGPLKLGDAAKNAVEFANGVASDMVQAATTFRHLVAGRLHGTEVVTTTSTSPVVEEPEKWGYEDVKAKWRTFIFKGDGAKAIAPVRREDIKGIDPIIQELDGYVHYLRHFEDLRGLDTVPEPPAAVLLEGGTGTGKTYSTQYVATAAGVRCVNVGDYLHFGRKGPSKLDVRALFETAAEYVEKKGLGLVVFWDEFDEFTNDSSTERNAAIKELKEQLSGLQDKPRGVVFLFATNKPQLIPDDLKRDGRIGMHFQFIPPDRDGLVELLELYVKKYPHEDEIDYSSLTHLIPAETVAPTVEERVKQAYFFAALDAMKAGHRPKITWKILTKVLLRHLIGLPIAPRFTDREKFVTAVHEIGHAVVGRKLNLDIPAVTIQPTAGKLGAAYLGIYNISRQYVVPLSVELARLSFYFGGQLAMEICGKELDQGMRMDLTQAARRATHLVERFGLGEELDSFSLEGLHEGRQHVQGTNTQNLSEVTLAKADQAAKKLCGKQRQVARDVLTKFGKERLEWLARQLVDRVTILGTDLDELIAEAETMFKKGQ